MVRTVSLIVLSLTKLRENTVVLHCLSPEFGRRSFISGVSRKAPMALFQPLSILDAEVVENPKSELWRLRNISCRYPLDGIRRDSFKNSISMFVSEVLYRVVTEGGRDDGFFDWCCRSILTLDALEDDYSNYHLRFLLELCGALGFAPSREDLAPFAGEQLETLGRLLDAGMGDSMLVKLSGAVRTRIARSLLDYISFHNETKLEIRSLAVLHELYA